MKTIHNIWRTLTAVAACVMALAACEGTVPAAPQDKYYRLLSSASAASTQSVKLPGEVTVNPLRGETLYGERAIIFADEQQRQLQQYHYQHWLYPPGELIQEHLAEYLRKSGFAPAVKLSLSSDALYAISGRIVRFERITVGGQAKAMVSLDLQLEKKGKLIFQKNYLASVAAPDASISSFTASMETGLNNIYAEFLGDLGRVKLD